MISRRVTVVLVLGALVTACGGAAAPSAAPTADPATDKLADVQARERSLGVDHATAAGVFDLASIHQTVP